LQGVLKKKGGVVGFVYPEGFKKNTEYILFLRSICLGVEGCRQRMVADPIAPGGGKAFVDRGESGSTSSVVTINFVFFTHHYTDLTIGVGSYTGRSVTTSARYSNIRKRIPASNNTHRVTLRTFQ
jgi:hypothetical protein